jgi:hypothetical protein
MTTATIAHNPPFALRPRHRRAARRLRPDLHRRHLRHAHLHAHLHAHRHHLRRRRRRQLRGQRAGERHRGHAALHHDVNLVNAWGVAFNPQGCSWIANAGSATSTLYDGNGVAQSLVVTLARGNPSGIVFNGSTDFSISAERLSGPAPFIFATLQGQISAWSPTVDATHSLTIVDDGAAGAAFTGLAIETGAGGDML